MIRYPVAIEPGNKTTAYGVVVPDLPGCFSAGDTLDEAMTNAEEASALWIDAALDAGQSIPAPGTLETLRTNRDYRRWLFGLIAIDPALLDDTVERINITLPRRVLRRIDSKAREVGETRSAYTKRMAIG